MAARPISAIDQALGDHGRRLEDAEDMISETRKAVFGIDKTMVKVIERLDAMSESMKTRGRWLEKLAIAAVIGIGGMAATEFIRLVLAR